ncbi:hypothetical protein Patl1_19764 [Pistacia atlantica]|uniref:Uncharacterized protein n=1 Tax=Pistacia atlantica TaxID=434234 RepID=A0ACC1BL19_9ROSI|nr:hypothetical protein Patl1_19764 [Pistacia atlantica]
MSSRPINWLNSSEFSYKTASEEPQQMDAFGKNSSLNWDRKAKFAANSGAVGSPRESGYTTTISKVTENVVCNPQFDPKKMDPLTKSISKVDSLSKHNTNSFNNYQRSQPSPVKPPNSEQPTTTSTRNADMKSNSITSHGQGSGNSSRSDSLESSSAPLRPHTGGDVRWDAINIMNAKPTPIGLSNFRLLKRLGYGDIGSVYLVELRGTNTYFAMKVMDKASLASRNKLLRAQTEREILGLLDHPFLPTLYSYFETDKFYCLVMEFCSGGNLHSLRQKQQNKHFTEEAARFYASEVLLALEYLHMLGIVYRDLKPENVLVREEGHIMLSDFDLSLRCSVSPTLVKSSSVHLNNGTAGSGAILNDEFAVHENPQVSFVARDLIRGLLVKEPHKRIAYKRGATEIKQHPFFEGVNWALVRSAMPPHIPEPVDFSVFAAKESAPGAAAKKVAPEAVADKDCGSPKDSYIEFEYF